MGHGIQTDRDFQGREPAAAFTFDDPAGEYEFSNASEGVLPEATLDATACYVAGTWIGTLRGDIAIELLDVGTEVLTASGEVCPIRWVGTRRVDCARHPNPASVWPICVSAGAMADGLPGRDLWVSPGHALLIEGRLIQAGALVNGISVRQVPRDIVEYWHVELDLHDVILAEGMPSETYLDTGNRTAFIGGGDYLEMHPDFGPRCPQRPCYPQEARGPAVARARQILLKRLDQLGHPISDDPAAHVVADGIRIDAVWITPTRMAFVLPTEANAIELRSRTFVPSQVHEDSRDARELGLRISRVQIDGEEVALEQLVERDGWNELEASKIDGRWRWTRGRVTMRPGLRLILLEICGKGFYRVGRDHVEAQDTPQLDRKQA